MTDRPTTPPSSDPAGTAGLEQSGAAVRGTRDIPPTGGPCHRPSSVILGRHAPWASARLFEETVKQRGFADTEIAVVSESVGVSRGAFYVHFSGKDEVLRELLLIEAGRIAAAALKVSGRGVPVDLAMAFLAGLFGLLATDDAPTVARRRRLDLLVHLISKDVTAQWQGS